jgi:transketolase
MHYESGVGHLGGNLSCLDVMLVLHHEILGSTDQFVLSKGHSAGAYYVTLWSQGKLSDDDLTQFHKDGTRLSGHPPTSGIEEILFATGSLGPGEAA